MNEYKKFLDWEKPGALLAWINIVLFLPLIPPVGLYCYWNRTKVDKTANLHTWKIFLLFGIMMTITACTLIARSGSIPITFFIGLALIAVGNFEGNPVKEYGIDFFILRFPYHVHLLKYPMPIKDTVGKFLEPIAFEEPFRRFYFSFE